MSAGNIEGDDEHNLDLVVGGSTNIPSRGDTVQALSKHVGHDAEDHTSGAINLKHRAVSAVGRKPPLGNSQVSSARHNHHNHNLVTVMGATGVNGGAGGSGLTTEAEMLKLQSTQDRESQAQGLKYNNLFSSGDERK